MGAQLCPPQWCSRLEMPPSPVGWTKGAGCGVRAALVQAGHKGPLPPTRKGPGVQDAQKMVPDPRREELNVAGAGVTCCSCPAPPRAAQPAPSPPCHPRASPGPALCCESSSPHVLHACARGCTPGTAQQTLILVERHGGSCSSPTPRAACALSVGPARAVGCKTPGWVLCGVLAVALCRGLGAVPRSYCFAAWHLSPVGIGCPRAGVTVTFEAAPLSAVVSYYAPRHRARLKNARGWECRGVLWCLEGGTGSKTPA